MTVGLTIDMLFPLGKELTCPVCLSLFKPPVARLQCCHYFCQSCIRETLCARSQCPICNTAARRRDITLDARMDRLADLYRQMEACTGEHVFCTQMPAKLEQEQEEKDDTPGGEAAQALPTVDLEQHQGADADNTLVHAEGEAAFDSLDMLVAETQCPEPDFIPLPSNRLHAQMPGQPSSPATEPASRGTREATKPAQTSLDKLHAAENRKETAPKMHGSKVSAGPERSVGRGISTPLQTFTREKRKTPESERGAATAATTRSKRNASDPQATAGGHARGHTEGSEAEMHTGAAERRRIPARLQPWSCQACTFDNPGAAARCSVCQAAKPPRHASASSEDGALHGQRKEDVPLRPAHKRAAAVCTSASAPPKKSTRVSQLKDAWSRRSLPAGTPVSRPRSMTPAPCSSEGVPSMRTKSGASRLDAAAGRAVSDAAANDSKRQRPSSAELADAEAARLDSGQQQPRGTGRQQTSSEADAKPAPVRWRGGRQNWVLLASGLEGPGREALRSFAAASGARLASSWQLGITHIICGLDNQKRAKRTFKYMMGILHGAWIVGESWVTACAAAGCPVLEEPHEVVGDANGNLQGPILGRLQRPAKLLHGTEVYLAGAHTSKEEVTALLRAAGARLLTRPPARQLAGSISGNAACRSVILWDEDRPRRGVAAAAGATQQLPLNWFLDSVSCFVVQPVDKYKL
ncbi:g5124 [Coccomyxa elongata]